MIHVVAVAPSLCSGSYSLGPSRILNHVISLEVTITSLQLSCLKLIEHLLDNYLFLLLKWFVVIVINALDALTLGLSSVLNINLK